MSDLEKVAKCLRSWPDAYHMGAHDRHVCRVAADALNKIEQLRRDNKALLACVKTAVKYNQIENPEDALNYLVRKLREAVSEYHALDT